jgi:hypothetical protein
MGYKLESQTSGRLWTNKPWVMNAVGIRLHVLDGLHGYFDM